jgi:hypothetical protein
MTFRANLIETSSSPAINLSLLGIIVFFLSIFAWALEVPETVALTATVSGLVMVLIGGVLSRNKLLYEVAEDLLVIDELTIKIKEQVFQLSDISVLQFYYDSFYSQSSFGYFTETSGMIEYGMKNTISFKSDDKDLNETFYLANEEQANNFFNILSKLTGNGIAYSYSSRASRR